MKPIAELDHYELLEISQDARPEEIERAYAMVRGAFGEDSLAAYSLFESDETASLRDRIDAAYEVLSDPETRRAYDARLHAEEDEPLEHALENIPELVFESVMEATPEPSGPPPELEDFEESDERPDDAIWDGARLRRSRMLRGVELEAIASITKINPTYLRFLEEERFDDLPAGVYVRGFVTAYAQYLGLDPRVVSASYLERYREYDEKKPRGRLLGRR